MSGWDDDEAGWGDDTDWTPPPSTTASTSSNAPSGASARVFGVDVGGLAGELVDAAVKASVKKQVQEVAEAAVEAALTDELIEALRERAEEAAVAAVTEQVEANDAAAEDPEPEELPPPELYFGSVDEFVREYLRRAYRRNIDSRSGKLWAGRWWMYDEAVIRLDALWRAWELLRRDASTGMSVWWRDHADYHMSVLMSTDNGPFVGIDREDAENRNRKGEPLPYVAPPEGLFPDVREQQPDAS